jgi:hypothetical protein
MKDIVNLDFFLEDLIYSLGKRSNNDEYCYHILGPGV